MNTKPMPTKDPNIANRRRTSRCSWITVLFSGYRLKTLKVFLKILAFMFFGKSSIARDFLRKLRDIKSDMQLIVTRTTDAAKKDGSKNCMLNVFSIVKREVKLKFLPIRQLIPNQNLRRWW
jgi:hypothetical protein